MIRIYSYREGEQGELFIFVKVGCLLFLCPYCNSYAFENISKAILGQTNGSCCAVSCLLTLACARRFRGNE